MPDHSHPIVGFREQSEKAAIGAALHGGDDGKEAERLRQLLPLDAFAIPAHVTIWQAICDLVDNGRPVDAASLVDELVQQSHLDQVGGPAYLSECIDAMPTIMDSSAHVSLLLEGMRLRRADLAITRAQLVIREGATAEEAAEALAAVATAATMTGGLGNPAPTFGQVYGVNELDADSKRRLVSVAHLPGWPGASPSGHGIGSYLDGVLGGGICPGYLLAIGAARAGAGKTAFAMQLADGLALRSVEVAAGEADGPLTPVLVLSEMSVAALTWRTLSRWTGVSSRDFRAGATAEDDSAFGGGNYVWDQARAALDGPLGAARERFLATWQAGGSGKSLLTAIAGAVARWRDDLARVHRCDVWPVVVVDPIQRWQDASLTEVEALNELVESLAERANRDGWIGILTSDTNKVTAGNKRAGSSQEEAGFAFRGSYKLLHLVDAAIFLRRADESGIESVIVKNRWGTVDPSEGTPRFRWHPKTGRFTPSSSEEARSASARDESRRRADAAEKILLALAICPLSARALFAAVRLGKTIVGEMRDDLVRQGKIVAPRKRGEGFRLADVARNPDTSGTHATLPDADVPGSRGTSGTSGTSGLTPLDGSVPVKNGGQASP